MRFPGVRVVYVVSLVIGCSLLLSSAASAKVLFEDDFSVENENWLVNVGNAWFKDGWLVMDPEIAAGIVTINQGGFTDFVVETSAKLSADLDQNGDFGIQFRTRKPGEHYQNSGYMVILQPNVDSEPQGVMKIVLYKANGLGGLELLGFSSTDVPYSDHVEPTALRVEVKGYHFKVFVNDRLYIDVIDEGINDTPLFNRGYIQLIKQYRVEVAWDYVRVTTID